MDDDNDFYVIKSKKNLFVMNALCYKQIICKGYFNVKGFDIKKQLQILNHKNNNYLQIYLKIKQLLCKNIFLMRKFIARRNIMMN